jgi:peptide/nickel transport system substrate-binding protein
MGAAIGLALAALTQVGLAQAQKYGGTLQAALPGNPPSLSIHEEATIFTSGPMQPVYNNLVYYDPFKPQEALDTIVPELAAKWRWNAAGDAVTFSLRQGIRFHDGKPFTGTDVKATFDIARGVSTQRLKLNPRRAWYGNIAEIVTNGDLEVTFRLKRPAPALLAMLASGFAPVMPAHRSPAQWRGSAVGTGPFVFREFQRDRSVLLEKNAAYWVSGRPYLDGVRFSVIPSQASRIVATKAQQVDIDSPADTIKPVMEALKGASAQLKFIEVASTGLAAVHFNSKKPPFNRADFRRVVSLAIDRETFIKGVGQGGMTLGGINLPPPTGVWGLAREQLVTLPGYGDPEKSRAEARRLMGTLGYGAQNPLKIVLTTRLFSNYADIAAWLADALKQVWIEADVRLIESGVYYGTVARREFTILLHPTGIGVDDPDVNFYEYYSCGSQRNYTDYCNAEIEAQVDAQAQLADPVARRARVQEIERYLLNDTARIVLGWFIYYNVRQPYVRNYIPHQTLYNFGRLQEVWLDK